MKLCIITYIQTNIHEGTVMDKKPFKHVHAIMTPADIERKDALGNDVLWEDVIRAGLDTIERVKKNAKEKK